MMTRHTRPHGSTVYVPVRQCQDDQHEWFDTGGLGFSPEQAREKAASVDGLIPSWAAMNPVVRIAHVTLSEETT